VAYQDFVNSLFLLLQVSDIPESVELLRILVSPVNSTHNLMFFWPCIMNWLYINYQLDALIIIYS